MVTRISFLLLVSFITWGRSRRETCNNLTCTASHSYCDEDFFCRCEREYPVQIELHSCRERRKYSEECDYTEECYENDKNSYCTHLLNRSICECVNGFLYSKLSKRCIEGKQYNEKCDYTEECYYYDKNSYCTLTLRRSICQCFNGFVYHELSKRCIKGKQYNEECEYAEECYYYDKNSNCSQLLHSSTCECANGFRYSELSKRCIKVFGDFPKTSYLVTPTALGLFFAFAGIICGGILLWYICRRPNGTNTALFENRRSSYSHYFSWDRSSQRSAVIPTAPTLEPVCTPSAPVLEEPLPTYDTALSLKVIEDCDPPSYKDVFPQASNSKT